MPPRTVVLADVLGFCRGVRRAVDLALGAADGRAPGRVVVFGELVHNQAVVERLREHGVGSIESIEHAHGATVVTRAHGMPKELMDRLGDCAQSVVDGTCPTVARIHRLVENRVAQGFCIVIAGQADHDEVAGVVSCSNGRAAVVETARGAETIDIILPALLIAQTTVRASLFGEIRAVLTRRYPGIECVDTVCPATLERQNAVRKLARSVDAIVVVGGRNSANTVALFCVAQETGKPAFLIEGAKDLPTDVGRYERIGIAAGASTPDWVIEQVREAVVSAP